MTKKVSFCLLAASLLAFPSAPRANAQSVFFSEVYLGVLAHDVSFLGHHKEGGADINGELLFLSPIPDELVSSIDPKFRWLLTPRPHIGFDANTSGYTSQLYLGLTWTADLFDAVFTPQDHISLSIGFGPSFNNGHVSTTSPHRKSLGSNVLFHPYVSIGYYFDPRWSLSIYWDHSSNAGLASENEGLNNAGLRVGLHF